MRRLPPKNPPRRRPFPAAGAAAAALCVCAGLRVFSGTGQALLSDFVSREGTAARLLDFELAAPAPPDFEALLLGALHSGAGAPPSPAPAPDPVPPAETPPEAASPSAPEPTPAPTVPPPLFYTGNPAAVRTRPADNAEPLPPDGILLTNTSGIDIDLADLLSEPLELPLAEDGPNVLIIQTHTSEAYTMLAPGEYEESDPYRTEDQAHSVVRVGDVLAEALSARGLNVLHDRGVYDYPSYAGCYGRTLERAKQYLAEYPSITLVLDLHRDAVEGADGSQFKTIADIDGDRCGQVMFFMGTDAAGLEHPGWRENLKLALRVQAEMNRAFPTLARPLYVSKYRYNQHLTPGSLLVEIGSTGNTLAEAERAAVYFAEAYSNVVGPK